MANQEEIRKTAEKLYWDFDANVNYCSNAINNFIDYLEMNALNEDNEHVYFWEAVKQEINDNSQNFE